MVVAKQGLPYSGLFSWVEIFVKCWIRSSELIFVVLIFVARTRVRAIYIGADDVFMKISACGWPKYSFNDIALHCTA